MSPSVESQLTLKDVKSRTDDDEMDLSLMQIEKIPVKVIASVPRVTTIDLSCNRIQVLPTAFCQSLLNLVALDLSKNRLATLPTNIGLLVKLKKLDLFDNQIQSLPVGMCDLRSLRWLDLKKNPLMSGELKEVAGDCLDDAGCRQCAKSVVVAMREAKQEALAKKEKDDIAKQKRIERKRRELEEEEKVRRQIEKEMKRKDKEQRRLKWEKENGKKAKQGDKNNKKKKMEEKVKDGKVEKSSSIWKLMRRAALTSMLMTSLSIIALAFYCAGSDDDGSEPWCFHLSSNLALLHRLADDCYRVAVDRTDRFIHQLLNFMEQARRLADDYYVKYIQ